MAVILTDREPPASRTAQEAPETHWIEYDAPRLGRGEKRALCGAIVSERLFSTEPSCVECRDEMQRLEGLEF